MNKAARKLMAGALAAVMVGSVSLTQTAYAAEEYVPPVEWISKTEITKDLTVANSINVVVRDENGAEIKDAAFQLIDASGAVAAEWQQSKKCVSASTDRTFSTGSVNIQAGQMYEVGELPGGIQIARAGGLQTLYGKEDLLSLAYGTTVAYVAHGGRALNVQTVTVPAGEVWINVEQGYKRDPAQTNTLQKMEFNGVETDLSDWAGAIHKETLPAGSYDIKMSMTLNGLSDKGGKTGAVAAADQDEEYVLTTLNLHAYCPKYVNENGRYINENGLEYTYGAPVVKDSAHITGAFMQISSGAVTNFVALDGSPTAAVYLKKGDYNPAISCSFIARNGGTATSGGGLANDTSMRVYEYAKHTITLTPPPAQGTTVGYIPAGTYTLHQTKTPAGCLAAEDRTVTVKDSCNTADLQHIEVVNPKQEQHVHTFSDVWTKNETSHWHAATCVHADLVRDKAEHTFGEWKTVTEPTTEQEGLKKRECTVCGYAQEETIAKLPPEKPQPQPEPEKPEPEKPEPEKPQTEPEKPQPQPEEKPEPQPQPAPQPQPKPVPTVTPQTGDSSNIMLWVILACVAGAALVVTVVVYNHKRKRG